MSHASSDVHTVSMQDMFPSMIQLQLGFQDLPDHTIFNQSHTGFLHMKAGQKYRVCINTQHTRQLYSALSNLTFTAPRHDVHKCPTDCGLPVEVQQLINSYLEPIHRLSIALEVGSDIPKILSLAQEDPHAPCTLKFPLHLYGTGSKTVFLRHITTDYLPTISVCYHYLHVSLYSYFNCRLRVTCTTHQFSQQTQQLIQNDSFWYSDGIIIINGLIGKITR